MRPAFLGSPTPLLLTRRASLFLGGSVGAGLAPLCTLYATIPRRQRTTTQMSLSTETEKAAMEVATTVRAPRALGHEMKYRAVGGLRRWARGWRLLRQVRGRLSKGTILVAKIGGSMPDAEPARTLFSVMGRQSGTSLEALTSALRLAAHDPRIGGVFVVVEALSCGWAKLLEIRRHLHYVQDAGKQVTVFAESGEAKEFFVGMGFEFYMAPLGTLGLRGFAVSATFVRGVLDKIGVSPQVERIGNYKSAGDQLSRTEMSVEQREMLESLLGEIESTWTEAVSDACGVTEAAVREIVERAPWDIGEYVEAGLLTGTKYLSEVREMLILRQQRKSESEKEEDVLNRGLKTVSLKTYRRRTREKMLGIGGPSAKRIGLIRANGAITSGSSGRSPVMGETLGSDSLVKLLRKAGEDKRIVAVVIRCDSPGGSALASDIVYREVRRLREKKPVIASMGDVSASGGYYISMGASDVVAENLTLTGSVGVVLAKLALGQLYDKIGYQKETLSIGKYAQLLADERSFTEEEAQYWRGFAEMSYKSFVTKAAEARGKSYEEMHEVAQGRVWTGRQAKDRGLVDHIGGLAKAVEVAKSRADMTDTPFVRVQSISEPYGLAKLLGLETTDIRALDAYGVNAPLAIAEFGATLDGTSPLVRFLAAAVAHMPGIAGITRTDEGGENVFGRLMDAFVTRAIENKEK